MATQLEDHGTHWVVKTIVSTGKQRRFPRLPVAVPKGDPEALRNEIMKQCVAARLKVGIPAAPREPVV